jgi:predicted Zn-dependent protease
VLGADTLAAQDGSAAAERADLLTTVMHEMGHALGDGHSSAEDLMFPSLSLGQRRALDAVDKVFAST